MADPMQQVREVLKDVAKERELTKKMIASLGPAIIEALTPVIKIISEAVKANGEELQVMKGIAESGKINNKELLAAIAEIKVNVPEIVIPESSIHIDVPTINVPTPQVTVNVPEIKIPEIKAPSVSVSAPQVTVQPSSVNLDPLLTAIKAMVPKEKDDSELLAAIQKLSEALAKPRTDAMKLDKDQFRELSAGLRNTGGGSAGPSTNGLVYDGRKVVSVTNTAVKLAADKLCEEVFITALTTNVDMVVIGGPGVIYTEAIRTGRMMNPGDSIVLKIHNLKDVFLNGAAGDGVAFTYTA